MTFSLEDKDGRPWTASTSLGWIVLISVLTFGTAAYLLALYLSLWVWRKGRSILPLAGFALPLILWAPSIVLSHTHLRFAATVNEVFGDIGAILWIVSSFTLRHEIKRCYKESEGWEIEIGPFFTFCFSAVYINYCINPVTLAERGTLTSLDLRK